MAVGAADGGLIVAAVLGTFYPNAYLLAIKWGLLTTFFALTVVGLFSFLKNARTVDQAHLYTAASIYLLLGLQWFALDAAIEAVYPGAILHTSTRADRESELMYFSLVNSIDHRLWGCGAGLSKRCACWQRWKVWQVFCMLRLRWRYW